MALSEKQYLYRFSPNMYHRKIWTFVTVTETWLKHDEAFEAISAHIGNNSFSGFVRCLPVYASKRYRSIL